MMSWFCLLQNLLKLKFRFSALILELGEVYRSLLVHFSPLLVLDCYIVYEFYCLLLPAINL